MFQSTYWADVANAVAEINAEVARQQRQPKDSTIVYITSVKRRGVDPTWRSDVVSLAPVKIAAQRLVENSHRLATDSEIEAYQKGQVESQKAAALSVGGNGKIVRFDTPKVVSAQDASK